MDKEMVVLSNHEGKYKWLGPIGYPKKICLMVYHGLPSFRQAKISISSLNNDWRIAGPAASVCWWVSPVGSRGIVYLLGLLDPRLLLDLFPLKGRMMVLAMIPGESENSPR